MACLYGPSPYSVFHGKNRLQMKGYVKPHHEYRTSRKLKSQRILYKARPKEMIENSHQCLVYVSRVQITCKLVYNFAYLINNFFIF